MKLMMAEIKEERELIKRITSGKEKPVKKNLQNYTSQRRKEKDMRK